MLRDKSVVIDRRETIDRGSVCLQGHLLETKHEGILLLFSGLSQLSVILLITTMILDHLNGISSKEDLLVIQLLTQRMPQIVTANLLGEGET